MEIFLTTDRLVLRRFEFADAANLIDLDSDPEVMRFLTGGKPTPPDVIRREVLPGILADYQRFVWCGRWAAIAKSTEDFLGWFELRPPEGDADQVAPDCDPVDHEP